MAKPTTVRGPYVIDELILKRAMGTSGRRYWLVYKRCTSSGAVWDELRKLTGVFHHPYTARTKIHARDNRVFRWRGAHSS